MTDYREWRFRKGLSQRDLANLANVSQSTISKLEAGDENLIRQDIMASIKEVLESAPDSDAIIRSGPRNRDTHVIKRLTARLQTSDYTALDAMGMTEAEYNKQQQEAWRVLREGWVDPIKSSQR